VGGNAVLKKEKHGETGKRARETDKKVSEKG
jgi:hypothetical protein